MRRYNFTHQYQDLCCVNLYTRAASKPKPVYDVREFAWFRFVCKIEGVHNRVIHETHPHFNLFVLMSQYNIQYNILFDKK